MRISYVRTSLLKVYHIAKRYNHNSSYKHFQGVSHQRTTASFTSADWYSLKMPPGKGRKRVGKGDHYIPI